MKNLLILMSLIWVTGVAFGQDQRFMGGFVLGFNASQIDGDQAAGFQYPGLLAGVRGGAFLSEKTMITMDILYSQRGSRRVPRKNDPFPTFYIKTPYIEVPVMFHYKDWKVETDEGDGFYYKVSIEAGPEFSRLLTPKAENSGYEGQLKYFNKMDIGWTAGVTYNFNNNFGVSFRYLRSITLLYNHKKHNFNRNSLLGYNFSFSAVYTL